MRVSTMAQSKAASSKAHPMPEPSASPQASGVPSASRMPSVSGMRESKLRVFVDADVLFAGAASPSEHPSGSASLVVLYLAELTLIEAVTSEQAVTECERNLQAKLPPDAAPRALGAFRELVARALRVVPNPAPDEVANHRGKSHPKDLPLLVCALQHTCQVLTTFNEKDYEPGDPAVEVLTPGALVRRVRALLAHMPSRA